MVRVRVYQSSSIREISQAIWLPLGRSGLRLRRAMVGVVVGVGVRAMVRGSTHQSFLF